MLLNVLGSRLITPTRLIIYLVSITLTLQASTVTIDFESFSDGELLTSQVPGVEFTNASIATAGISLNELEFPPHSGSNVAIDSGGPIDVTFSSPIDQFGGYFTYSTRLSLEAFGAGNTELGLVQSKFSSNLAISGVPGSSPNELLQFSSSQGIDSVLITGSSKGNSFAMDDIFVTTTPEPNYLLLLAGALAVAGVVAQKRK